MITRDFSVISIDVTGVSLSRHRRLSLSLSLLLTKVTHAQYRKRFRVSYNMCVGSRGAVVSAALSERKVAGSIPTIGDFHTVGPCNKAVFARLATDVK